MSKVSNNLILIAWQVTSHIATDNSEQAVSMKVNIFSQSLQKLINILHQAKTTSNGRTVVTN